MDRFEYMRLKLTDLPENVVQHYKLSAKVTKDCYVYVKCDEACTASPKPG